ncbi:hypothetical protein G6F68_020079 [Rhizopus microsporus]|nr:hypothetical protein G6F68_020079 [Rhizopus microsporus]
MLLIVDLVKVTDRLIHDIDGALDAYERILLAIFKHCLRFFALISSLGANFIQYMVSTLVVADLPAKFTTHYIVQLSQRWVVML